MLAKKWNFSKQMDEDYELPEGATPYLDDIDMYKTVSCARCKKDVLFGNTYKSALIHTQEGLEYAVCGMCRIKECEEAYKYYEID